MGRKQIARVRFFHGLTQLSDEQIAWLAHIEILRNTQCGCGSDLFLYPTTGTDALHACHIHLLPVCAFPFHPIYQTGTYPPPGKHHTRRTVAKRCVKGKSRQRNVFQRERWYGESKSQRRVLYTKKAAARCNRRVRSERGRSSPVFMVLRGNSFTRQKSLASLSQYE